MKEVITADFSGVVNGLKELGFTVLTVEKSPFISNSLATHSDMLAVKIGCCIVLDRSQKDLYDHFNSSGRSCIYSEKNVRSGYPEDVPLNCAVVGGHLICRKSAVSKTVLTLAENNGLKIVDVNQGYAKCSTCVVDENSVITDDISIHRACCANKIESLLVSKGSVGLAGYDYGFIGGCSGLLEKGLLAFCGDISTHADFAKIDDFLKQRGVEYVSLFNGELIDVGGIIAV